MRNVIWFLWTTIIMIVSSKMIEMEKSNHALRLDYSRLEKSPKDEIHEVIFAIQQRNIDVLEGILYDVSMLDSPNYGKHKTFEEIGELIENRQATNTVIRWLQENGVAITEQTRYGEYITCSTTIGHWETLLAASFHVYLRENHPSHHPNTIIVHRTQSYSLPEHIASQVHAVFRTIELPPRVASKVVLDDEFQTSTTTRKTNGHSSTSQFQLESLDGYVTPSVLYNMYGIVRTLNETGSQAVYESNFQTYIPSDLTSFESMFNISQQTVSKTIGTLPSSSICKTTLSYCAETTLDLDYIIAVGSSIPTILYYDESYDGSFVTFAKALSNTADPANIYSISYVIYEVDLPASSLKTFNTEAIKLGARGVSLIAATGDDGVTGYAYSSYKNSSECGYYAQFPASSPYVTAVGGTMGGTFIQSGSSEITCSSSAGSAITTGGGFSNTFPVPSYQFDAINSYATKFTPKQTNQQPFNMSNRGYPDVALAANKYAIVLNGVVRGVSGTSASAPVFAGMVGLVNSQRLKRGQSVLGWLNPTIYSNNGDFANDITIGNNSCTSRSGLCCNIGFEATSGWDATTGFGSINFTRFLDYYMYHTPTNQPTSIPSASPTVLISKLPTTAPTTIPTRFPTVSPTTKSPTTSPSQPPTNKPSISHSSNDEADYQIIQQFQSTVLSSELLSDPSAIQGLTNIIYQVLGNFTVTSITIDRSSGGVTGDDVKQSMMDLTSIQIVNINYTLQVVIPSNTVRLTEFQRLVNRLNVSVTSGEFTSLLSSSPILSGMTCLSLISISTLDSLSSPASSASSSSSRSSMLGIIIGASIGGVFILFLLLFIVFSLCKRKEIQYSHPKDEVSPVMVVSTKNNRPVEMNV